MKANYNYPEFIDVAKAVVAAFNKHGDQLNLSAYTAGSLPIKVHELWEQPVRGGMSSNTLESCRHMVCYIMAHKVQAYDHFGMRWRFLSNAAIAAHLNRSPSTIRKSIVRGCHQRHQGPYPVIYKTAIAKLKAQGFDLFSNGVERCQ